MATFTGPVSFPTYSQPIVNVNGKPITIDQSWYRALQDLWRSTRVGGGGAGPGLLTTNNLTESGSVVTLKPTSTLNLDGTWQIDGITVLTTAVIFNYLHSLTVPLDGTIPIGNTSTGKFVTGTIGAGSNKLAWTAGSGTLSVDVVQGNIDHNSLSNFVSNKHIDHTTVSISAGGGLTGGGDISSTRTVSLDINGQTNDAIPDGAADYTITYDASATGFKKVLLNNLPAQTNLTTHINNTTGAHAATAISNTPAGSIAAVNVQTAINELDTEKFPYTGGTITGPTLISIGASSAALEIRQAGAGNALLVEDSTSVDATPFVIDNSGNIIKGSPIQITVAGVTGAYQQHGTSTSTSSFSITGWSATTSPSIQMGRSRGAVGDFTSVADGDTLGIVRFVGSDGTDAVPGTLIQALVDGTPATNSVPGKILIRTRLVGDTSNSGSVRFIINNAGEVNIGTTDPTTGNSYITKKPITGAVTAHGIQANGQIQSDVTTKAYGFRSSPSIVSAVFTLPTLSHFSAIPGTKGASATLTDQIGFEAGAGLTAATNNYGFYGNIATSANRWNAYMVGTAPNYFAGLTTFGAKAGYGTLTGVGGTVTQVTSKATGVTLNKVTGQITTAADALAATTTVAFTLTNSTIEADDTIIIHRKSGGTAASYMVYIDAVAAGSCRVAIRNTSAGSLSEALVLQYSVIRGAIA